MALDEKISINEIISLTANGITTASFAQVRGALIDRFQQIFGTDIDLSTNTADGLLVWDLSLIIYNMAQTIQKLYAETDVNQADGQFLDSLAAMANVYRQQPKNSYTAVSMTFTGNAETTYTQNQLTIIDRAGKTWAPQYNVTFTPGGGGTVTKNVPVYCTVPGPIDAPAGWLVSFANAALPITFTQPTAAITGQDREDDIHLRSRIYASSGASGMTVLEGLINALLNIQGVEDVYVYNNPNSTARSALEQGQDVDPHSIYAVLRIKEGLTVADSQIGSTIYDNLTPGVQTTECIDSNTAKSYTYNLANLGPHQTLLPIDTTANVYWKQAAPQTGDLEFTIVPRVEYGVTLFDPDMIPEIVASVVSQLNERHINDSVSEDEFVSMILSADPGYNGRKTFTLTDIGGSAGTLVPDELSDDYYEYSGNYVVTEDGGNYVITITEA